MTSPITGPLAPGLHRLYIPAVCLLISFQGYYSQYLFNTEPDLAPGPLTRRETITFNTLLLCLWYTYYRACTVDPGRYIFSPSSEFSSSTGADPDLRPTSSLLSSQRRPRRFCKKCSAPKPLRAHHCRHCGRCIPKMDHHCPWTGNCVSMQTFPYFLRFLVYTNVSLWYLARLLWQRVAGIWASRKLPAYLGPSVHGLVGVTVLGLANMGTMVALGILLITTVKAWVWNCTMIEEWEVERHEAVLARLGGDDEQGEEDPFWGDDTAALRARLEKIEFPYDLGVWKNMSQAMGTRNVLRWFLPFGGGGPVVDNSNPGKGAGWEWEENGFNDLPGMWPPPDPEKMRREARGGWPAAVASQQQPRTLLDQCQTAEEIKEAFRRRQEEDLRRRQKYQALERKGIIEELEEVPGKTSGEGEWIGEPAWTNSEGERLWDYGVDEGADEEDMPLAELMRRRKVSTHRKYD
ncbi:palmitoyltransferase pfa4-like protein [Thermochaetoides thermophila DSM 1495]|uniref:Palmitoyltransferase PFA4 n=1 Tax=Chaetomium thermophilum (strain DSM 1495 / CBS 144.50 / IMI 039719) TaxID=759272 RepID=G0SCX0_CHATD|nr:palmitoyltransferase pfa4-like protein [Thermochaetoides thermophila DSM 1495]EGS19241.1 palmitoyltransferase pfa4-like protein [Thermochaetoides thermophila DSM 1495]